MMCNHLAATKSFTDTIHLNNLYWNVIHCHGFQPEFCLESKVKRSLLAAKWLVPSRYQKRSTVIQLPNRNFAFKGEKDLGACQVVGVVDIMMMDNDV
jgi:hypothetical protein